MSKVLAQEATSRPIQQKTGSDEVSTKTITGKAVGGQETTRDTETPLQRNLTAFTFASFLLLLVALGVVVVPKLSNKKRGNLTRAPITTERLQGNTLTEIGSTTNLRVVFDDEELEITYRGGLIPIDVVNDFLGEEKDVAKITASWRLGDDRSKLHVWNIQADDTFMNQELILDIKPAGPMRINLGSRQYNTYPQGFQDSVELDEGPENADL